MFCLKAEAAPRRVIVAMSATQPDRSRGGGRRSRKVSLMSGTRVAWIALTLVVAAAAGCRMCASPYDYCSPTFTGSCGEDCASFVRAGSVLSAPLECSPLPPEGYIGQQIPQDEEIARIQVDEEDASPIILSLTDKEVELADDDGPTPAVEEGPSLPVEEAPTLPVELDEPSSDGWRAVKRRPESVLQ